MVRFAAVVLALIAAPGCVPDAPTTLSGPSGSHGNGSTTGAGGATSTSTAASTTSASTGTGNPATFTVSLDDAMPAIDLAAQLDLKVTVVPHGYMGNVSLTATGLSNGGVAASFGTSMLTLDGSTNATTTLTLKTGSSTAPKALPFSVDVFASGGTASAPATLTVHSAITIHIPANANSLGGTQANPYKTAFGPYPIPITAPPGISAQKPVTVRFFNDDSVSHEIHASQATEGFDHDPGPIAPHSMDSFVRQVSAADTYDFYLHDQNQPITIGRIVIQ